jgi:hypothetical protein
MMMKPESAKSYANMLLLDGGVIFFIAGMAAILYSVLNVFMLIPLNTGHVRKRGFRLKFMSIVLPETYTGILSCLAWDRTSDGA